MLAVLIFLMVSHFVGNAISIESQPTQQGLPFCDVIANEQKNTNSEIFIFVSTLDGSISALDITKGVEKKWSIPTSTGQMLSSSIHNLELTNNGQWVRMIPSLSGSLYKFDGETVEPIPVNADHLLSSSFKFSDDLVISGGKETISYGVSAQTGRVMYECSMLGCINSTITDSVDQNMHTEFLGEDIIVVRRQTQTVRAVEPRTGGERWNFSVGYHELELVRLSDDCHSSDHQSESDSLNYELKFIVPEGVVYAIEKRSKWNVLWKYKFDFPIVNVWERNGHNDLIKLDLFANAQSMWQGDTTIDQDLPSLYVGMFKKQLYIQESQQMRLIQSKIRTELPESNNHLFAQIPWQPYEVSSSSLVEIESIPNKGEENNSIRDETEMIPSGQSNEIATSVLYASEYVNGNGFYLYSASTRNKTKNKDRNIEEEIFFGDEDDDFNMPPVNVVSLWYWWKEIVVISLTTALVVNVMLSQRKSIEPEVVVVERHVEIKVPATPDSEKSIAAILDKRKHFEMIGENEIPFKSRFQSDFDMLRCLGKGGFGVVFEVKNKLDDCNYAIKRILLPESKKSRGRVMREVKTLANCEHQNIVRYFNSWVESPPPGWQESEDQVWMSSHSIDIDSPTSETPSRSIAARLSIIGESFRKEQFDSILSALKTNECINLDDDLRKTKFNYYDDNDDSSFIQFKAEEAENDKNDSSNAMDSDDEEEASANSVFSKPKIIDTTDDDGIVFHLIETHKQRYQTQRSYSLGTDLKMHDDDSETNDSKYIDLDNLNDTWSKSSYAKSNAAIRNNNGAANVIPFKRTHRRPLSLDLTSRSKSMREMRKQSIIPVPRMYLYIQMQLCRKQSLKDWLQENDLTIRKSESIGIFKQIVEAVEYVHLKGLIHRDLKPGNIFFSLDGQIRIGDFGLVTDMDCVKGLTSCGDETGLPSCAKHTQQVGTHLYMSPEQLRGRPYNYKVDIYSLGLIFFELLVVFGTEMERMKTLRELRSSKFPNDFRNIHQDEYNLLKLMLSKNPDKRPTTYGIRARPPFNETTDQNHHFELPPRRRDSQSFSSSNSSSCLIYQTSSDHLSSKF